MNSLTVAVSGRRVSLGVAVALALPPAITVGMLLTHEFIGPGSTTLLFLFAVVLTALIGGVVPAVVASLVSLLLLNYFFIEPTHTLRINQPHDFTSVVVFFTLALLIGGVVHRAASTSRRATRSAAQADTLAAVAQAIIAGDEALPALLAELRTAFGMIGVALLETSGGEVRAIASRGTSFDLVDADVVVSAGDSLLLALCGRDLDASDRLVLESFAAQAGALRERDQLKAAAARADRLAEADAFRNALLAALGHDVRGPLASARAAVGSLRSTEVAWSEEQRDELLADADRSLRRLSRLTTDLLDLSRLQTGVLRPEAEQVYLDELVGPALDELGHDAAGVTLAISDDLPPATGDGALVTRILVNLISNALRHGGEAPVVIRSEATPEAVSVSVVDRGPGVGLADRERIFRPFQRLTDVPDTGLGLGLALSRGLAEAMGGQLLVGETPGGGLTMTLRLPRRFGDVEGDDET